jgi:hypothetical protein
MLEVIARTANINLNVALSVCASSYVKNLMAPSPNLLTVAKTV